MALPVLFQDDEIIVVHKPAGLLVHRSLIDRHATEFAMQTVRDQTGKHVYLVHRLDRPTSGALLLGFSPESARVLSEQFQNGLVTKKYVAIVRGIPPERVIIDYALREELDRKSDKKARTDKPAQEAITHVTRLASCELPVQVDKFPTSRYALVRAEPKTGRKHQIRRHLRHLGHPIIGDVTHGSGKHNRYFETAHQSRRLLLACVELGFLHPGTGAAMSVRAPLASDFKSLVDQLGWGSHVE